MKQKLRTHWTSLLGALFVITAFITLFQFSVEKGWITNALKIGFGLLSGIGLGIAGLKLSTRDLWRLTGEIVLGIGACVLYATIAYAGITDGIWSPMTVLLGMSSVTIAMSWYAFRNHSRMLMILAVSGGLLAPLLMRPESDHVLALFLYLLVMNVAFIFLSMAKDWIELRITSFAGSWILYIVYFIHFSPFEKKLWNMPIRYAIAAFLFYMIALVVASRRNTKSFDGLNVYLNIANGILFGFWAFLIWREDVQFGYVLGLMGIVYLLGCFAIYWRNAYNRTTVRSYGLGGSILLIMALNSIAEGVLMSVLVWISITILLVVAGHLLRWQVPAIISVALWFNIVCYWYAITWTTPRGEWFGIYIPFLNWGAVTWILLAGLGFYYAKTFQFPGMSYGNNHVISRIFALIAHLIVGGLLTRQIENIFTEHLPEAPAMYMHLTITLVWGCYALILVLWGTRRQDRLFRGFGYGVLVITAIKAIFLDLSGQEALYKVAILFILAGISFFITWINGKWKMEDEASRSGE